MKILLIYNPYAGHGRAGKILPQVEEEFRKQQIEFDLHLTDYPGHGIEIVRSVELPDYNGIVAAGGDGTLFEVINGYFANASSRRIPPGILPVGTGNAFARDLNLHVSNWQEAVKIISLNKTRRVDVGRFICAGNTYYFLNILGLGFVADVTKTAHKLKILGNISYSIGVFYQMLFLKTSKLRIEIDGRILERDNVFTEISNTTYTSNFYMAPAAKIDDGLLDVTLLNKISRVGLIKAFPKVFTGEHVHLKEVDVLTGKKIKISTSEPKVLTPDGELLGSTPVEIECLPRAIEVFWK